MDWLNVFLLNTSHLSYFVSTNFLTESDIVNFSKINKRSFLQINIYFKRSLFEDFPFLKNIRTPQINDEFETWIQLYYQFEFSKLPYYILECIDLNNIDMRIQGSYELISPKSFSQRCDFYKSERFDIQPRVRIQTFSSKENGYFVKYSNSSNQIETKLDPNQYSMSNGFYPFNFQKMELIFKEKLKPRKEHIYNVLKDYHIDSALLVYLVFAPFSILRSQNDTKIEIVKRLYFYENNFDKLITILLDEVSIYDCFDIEGNFNIDVLMNFINLENMKISITN